jgi:F420H(2)-dependent quinone reductase
MPVDERIQRALENDRTIDITTTGRTSGQPRRIEIWMYRISTQGSGLSLTPDRHLRVFLSGSPGTRDWYANLVRHPEFTFHLKGSVQADLPAIAHPITDEAERREVIRGIREDLGRGTQDLEDWVERSPLVEVEFRDQPVGA